MSAWLLPDHIADVLPSEARHIEELRRDLLDTARAYGYELVTPPLLEYLTSLLSGASQALNLQTFKLVDQLSGRSMGLRADTTPQVARIDAHLLNRRGVARLCYCGPVVHTRPASAHATREPMQFGAEIYGHAGVEADLEILELALDCLRSARLPAHTLDLADARIVSALLESEGAVSLEAEVKEAIHAALAAKDVPALSGLVRRLTGLSPAARQGLLSLPGLYGDAKVLDEAARVLPALPAIAQALAGLRWLARSLGGRTGVSVGFDLADLRGYGYYSGMRFAVYAEGVSDALLRGGRYDEVGAVFGRKRPAVGFSLDLKTLVGAVPERALRAAIRAPWPGDDLVATELRAAIARLRAQGETVVCVLPGHESEVDEFHCDRELIESGGTWSVRAIASQPHTV
ncbi:ATP phosphoribosyltransferase regulatory subunit [Hylemonella sp. W303a]|uniref:ATP phosphoribosyltransferase regulatory subunit n=1 Tax=Hylemonella sp. W303a TaxID=3389873 RepID=UPI00396B2ED3